MLWERGSRTGQREGTGGTGLEPDVMIEGGGGGTSWSRNRRTVMETEMLLSPPLMRLWVSRGRNLASSCLLTCQARHHFWVPQ